MKKLFTVLAILAVLATASFEVYTTLSGPVWEDSGGDDGEGGDDDGGDGDTDLVMTS